MLFNFVLYFAFLTFLDSSVTDESFVDETGASGVYTKFSPGIYDEFIYNHCVDATAAGDFFPRGYHQPRSQHFCADMNYHWYGYIYKLTVYKILNFWNAKAFLPQA